MIVVACEGYSGELLVVFSAVSFVVVDELCSGGSRQLTETGLIVCGCFVVELLQ